VTERESNFESQAAGSAGGRRNYLVVDAKPVPWSLEATMILRVVPQAEWDGAVMDLDVLFGGSPARPTEGHVIVLQTHDGNIAVGTSNNLHLESFDESALLPIPKLIFGDAHEHVTAKHLLFAQDTQPIIVLNSGALSYLSNTQSKGTCPRITAGETES